MQRPWGRCWMVLSLLVHAAVWSAEPQVFPGIPLEQVATTVRWSPQPAYDVATTALARLTLRFALPATPTPAMVRQAVCHSAGLWWTTDHDEVLVTGTLTPLRSTLGVTTVPTRLNASDAHRTLVELLMAPWLAATGGLASPEIRADAREGSWIATLDARGQDALVTVLATLERSRPSIPPLRISEALAVQPFPCTLPAGPWGPWMRILAERSGCAVSLGPDIGPSAPAVTCTGVVGAALASAGLEASLIDGTWTIGHMPEDRQLPIDRRFLAVVPVPQLVHQDGDGPRLAAQLMATVLPQYWQRPGWTVAWHGDATSLIIAADAPTIHAVLDAVERLDCGQ